MSPCGYAMSPLRTMYSTLMRPYRDSDATVTIDWYETEADALPFDHRFGSMNDDEEHAGWDGPGEVYLAPRGYLKGPQVGDAAGTGPPCGTAEQWATGALLAEGGVPVDAFGTPLCCQRKTAPFLFFGCATWPRGVYSVYTLVVAGATGLHAPMNGTFRMDYSGPLADFPSCNWTNPVEFYIGAPGHRTATWRVYERVAEFFLEPGILPYTVVTSYGFVYDLRAWDPLRDYRAPVAFQFGPVPGVPATVLIRPGFDLVPPNNCPALAATSAVYYLNFSASGPIRPLTDFALFPEAGWCAVFQSAPCIWEGTVFLDTFNALQIPVRNTEVPITLEVLAGGSVRVTVRASVFGNIFADGVYTSMGSWDGNSVIALLPAFTPPGTTYYANVCQVNPPRGP